MDSVLCTQQLTADRLHALKQFVWDRTNGGVRQLEVAVDGNSVILSGESDSFYYKQLATHAVMDDFDIDETLEFSNQIVVTAGY